MNIKDVINLSAICAIYILLQGCSVVPQNLTPNEFPYLKWRDRPNSTFYPVTYNDLSELANDPKHRFLLEIKETGGADTRNVYVSINGNEHQMTNYGHRLWYYDSSNECQMNYSYYFRVRYKAGWYGYKVETLGSPEEPFHVTTSDFGNITWGVPGDSVSSGTEGEVKLGADYGFTRTILIQNLKSVPIVITYIEIDPNHVRAPDSDQFEVTEKPNLPLQLNCGEKLAFKVRWNAPSFTSRATGAVKFGTSSPLYWGRSILLKGIPQAP